MTTIPVLLIDDSEPDRLYASIMLARSGHPLAVREFESAAEALAVLASSPHPPNIILLDINMPGMDGFEFLDAYERLPEANRGETVIVMLTSSPLDSDRERALSHSAVKEVIVKPLNVPQAQSLAMRFGSRA